MIQYELFIWIKKIVLPFAMRAEVEQFHDDPLLKMMVLVTVN